MTILESIRPFWPLLVTFVLPRAVNYYRAVRTALRTSPPPQPLTEKSARALNALFLSIATFLYCSLPFSGSIDGHNVFVITQSRLSISTEALFSRLALLRDNGLLTQADDALRAKLTSQALRRLYLRFGPSTLLNCTFCQSDDDFSYLLYHLPTNVLLPHLFHLLCLGFATSATVSGPDAGRWRSQALIGGLALVGIDLAVTMTYAPMVDARIPAPMGTFWLTSTLRYLALCFFDIVVAFLIYALATRRFLLFMAPLTADPEVARRRTVDMLNQANLTLQLAQTNMRAYSIARNAVVRNQTLKNVDDEYWRSVVAAEHHDDQTLFEDEEVQAAMSRTYGTGAVDLASLRREADTFVRNATKILDRPAG